MKTIRNVAFLYLASALIMTVFVAKADAACYTPWLLHGVDTSAASANSACTANATYNNFCQEACNTSCPGKTFAGVDGCNNATQCGCTGLYYADGRCKCGTEPDDDGTP